MSKKQDALMESWAEVLNEEAAGPINGHYKKWVTARLLENTEKAALEEKNGQTGREHLSEQSNQTNNMDIADPVLINLVRRTAPNLMAYDFAGVQPMSGPTGLIFAMRSYYGAPPDGPFGRPGDARFPTGGAVNTAGETVAQQNAAAGVAANEAFFDEARAGYSGNAVANPSTAADFYDVPGATNFGKGMATGTGEALTSFPEMGFTIEKTSVEAKTRLLKAEYTVELQQDLRAVHGLDAETELANILSTELLAEINREMVFTIRRSAELATGDIQYNSSGAVVVNTAGNPILTATGTWDIAKNSDGRWSAEKYKSLLVKINKEANAIAKRTRRGRGNFIICSSNVASVLDLTGKLVYSPAIDDSLVVDDTGNTFVGILMGRFKVYIDPYLSYDEIIVGYKGATPYDAGIFYCPYVPLQMVKAYGENSFQPKIAFRTRYGIVANPFTTLKSNSNRYFRKFRITGL